MYSTDREAFTEVLRKLSLTFSKELTDDLRTAYWEALKDLPLSTVQRLGEAHSRYGKFFPKPFELRPKDDRPKVSDPTWPARKAELDRQAAAHLDELWHENRAAWLAAVSPKVYEIGRAKGMPDGRIALKLDEYVPGGKP